VLKAALLHESAISQLNVKSLAHESDSSIVYVEDC